MIVRLLQTKRWSPEQISDQLARRKAPISHETIYRMIRREKHAGGDLWRCLRRRGKRYNKRADKTVGRVIIPGRIDISFRQRIVACAAASATVSIFFVNYSAFRVFSNL